MSSPSVGAAASAHSQAAAASVASPVSLFTVSARNRDGTPLDALVSYEKAPVVRQIGQIRRGRLQLYQPPAAAAGGADSLEVRQTMHALSQAQQAFGHLSRLIPDDAHECTLLALMSSTNVQAQIGGHTLTHQQRQANIGFRLHPSGQFTYSVRRHSPAALIMEYTPLDPDAASVVDSFCPDLASSALSAEQLVTLLLRVDVEGSWQRKAVAFRYRCLPLPITHVHTWHSGMSLYACMRRFADQRIRALVQVSRVDTASGSLVVVPRLEIELTEVSDDEWSDPVSLSDAASSSPHFDVSIACVAAVYIPGTAPRVDLLPLLLSLLPKKAGALTTGAEGTLLLERRGQATELAMGRELTSLLLELRVRGDCSLTMQLAA